MSTRTSFGRWVHGRRKELDLTREELAALISCALPTVEKLEAGTQRPSKQVAELLAVALQVPPADRPAFLRFARTSEDSAGFVSSSRLMAPAPQAAELAALLPPTNLPAPLTPLIGRVTEAVAIGQSLLQGGARLLTLTGPPGVGKTRLGLHVGATLRAAFPDGVYFVPLAALTDPGLVIPTIAATLGVQELAGQRLGDQLTTYLRDRHMLLLLDNFEQVGEAAAAVSGLLAAATRLQVLITSRARLQVYGEYTFPVPPLPTPDPGAMLPVASLLQYAAIQLFCQRAHAAQADFALTDENAAAVAEICRRLDGLPLALELAAAWVRRLAPAVILVQLEQRLALLTDGPWDVPERQRTLRGAIAWSVALLSAEQQRLFRRLAVFVGGGTPEAIIAVCGGGLEPRAILTPNPPPLPPLEGDVLAGVAELARHSLVQAGVGRDGQPRFWLLETIREYAREQLAASEEEAQLGARHLGYFLALAEAAEPHLDGAEQQRWLDRLEEEHDNLRAALDWAGARGADPSLLAGQAAEAGLQLAGALARFWEVRGHWRAGRAQLAAAVRVARARAAPAGQAGVRQALLARAQLGAARLACVLGDYAESQALAAESLALGRAIGGAREVDPMHQATLAGALHILGDVAWGQGDYPEARARYAESLAFGRALGDQGGIAWSLSRLGTVTWRQGDYAEARMLIEESLALFRAVNDPWGLAAALVRLGGVVFEQGDYPAARAFYQESLRHRRALGDRRGMATTLGNLGCVAYIEGDTAGARALYEESLALYQALGDRRGIAWAFLCLGNVAVAVGDYPAARALLAESLLLRRGLGERPGLAESLAGLGGVLVGEAGQADAATRAARWTRAAQVLGAVAAGLGGLGAVLDTDVRLPYERAVTEVRAALGEEAFAAAWAAGQALSLEEASAHVLAAPAVLGPPPLALG